MRQRRLTHHGRILNRVACPIRLRSDNSRPASISLDVCAECKFMRKITYTYVDCEPMKIFVLDEGELTKEDMVKLERRITVYKMRVSGVARNV